MCKSVADLRVYTLESLTADGCTEASAVRHSDTVVIASVPVTRRAWAQFALASLTVLPLQDQADRARFAVFTAPGTTEPYERTVYFRATGDRLPDRFADRELRQTVRVIPGYSTEEDIPKALAVAMFGTTARTDDITVTRLA
jgi:hypothetical protein